MKASRAFDGVETRDGSCYSLSLSLARKAIAAPPTLPQKKSPDGKEKENKSRMEAAASASFLTFPRRAPTQCSFFYNRFQ